MWKDIQYHKVNYVVEADLHAFFDTLNQQWLIRFLEHDIADKRLMELIGKMLKAGVMEEGKFWECDRGSGQGSSASPILANVYLHYVLDLWFDVRVRKYCRGEAYLVRYADDFVTCFQYESDAKQYYQALKKRFAKFDLSLSPEKTKVIEFGRFAQRSREKRHQGKPETFHFLGFTFYCGKSRAGKFLVKVKSDRKKVAKKMKELHSWLKEHRKMPVKELILKLNRSLKGYYQYYGVTFNYHALAYFRYEVGKALFKWLNSPMVRSQEGNANEKIKKLL